MNTFSRYAVKIKFFIITSELSELSVLFIFMPKRGLNLNPIEKNGFILKIEALFENKFEKPSPNEYL